MIFVSGIHGIGKSYYCKYLGERLGVAAYSASTLINQNGVIQYSGYKKVNHILENQEYLIKAIKEKNQGNEKYLLDGHTCLINSKGRVIRIPYTTFEKIGMQAMIVLYGNIDWTYERIKEREKNVNWIEKDKLRHLQLEEIYYAEYIASSLSLPLTKVSVDMKFSDIIESCAQFINSAI